MAVSSVDLPGSRATAPTSATAAPQARRRPFGTRLLGLVGGFILTGIFLALSGAVFAVVAIYSLIWWTQLS